MDITLYETLTDVTIAFLQVEFPIKLLSRCKPEKISLSLLDTELIAPFAA